MPSFTFEYDVFADISDISPDFQQLIIKAREAAEQLAYAPYSHFRVGAVALLANEAIVKGTNQENASFPAGICAERVALYSAAMLYPDVPVSVLAIAHYQEHATTELMQEILSPCGICRQVIAEVTQRQQQAIRLLLSSAGGPVVSIADARQLLPFAFDGKML